MLTHSILGRVTLVIAVCLNASPALAQIGAPALVEGSWPAAGGPDASSGVPGIAARRTMAAATLDESLAVQTRREASPWPRAYIVGRGGLTFATRVAPLLGAEVGGHVAPLLQAYGSFDWHRDISPSFVEDLGDLISDLVDADVNYRLPTLTALGGLKVIAPRGTIRPYGVGGIGYGRVNGIVEIEGDDVTDLLDEFGYLDRDDVSFNKVLFEAGGGVSMSNGRLYADISYRFRKFLQTGESINMSGLYAGVGIGF